MSTLDDALKNFGYAKVVVELKSGNHGGAGAAATGAAAKSAGASIASHFINPGNIQTKILEAVAKTAASKPFHREIPLPSRRVRVFPNLGLAIGYIDAAGAAGLKADPHAGAVVIAPEVSLIRPVAAHDTARKVSVTWGIERMGVPRLWAAGHRGQGVVVGHLDTGIDGKHPALKNAIADFAEFDYAGDRVADAEPWDSEDHGTHTAGTIVGRATARGQFGVAPEAQIASGMVIEGGQVIDRILSGMEWIASDTRNRVLSMSLGLRGTWAEFQIIVNALRRRNILPIIAVGNEGPRNSRSPGNYAEVLSVGAIDRHDRVADFSCSQRFDRPDDPIVPDLVAPGVSIFSCVPGGYAEMDGTSMATPHVAGLAALLFGAKPEATIDQVEDAIFKSCGAPKGMSPERGNRGVPDAVEAFRRLTGESLLSKPSTPRRAGEVASRTAKGAGRTAFGRHRKSASAKKKKASAGKRKSA